MYFPFLGTGIPPRNVFFLFTAAIICRIWFYLFPWSNSVLGPITPIFFLCEDLRLLEAATEMISQKPVFGLTPLMKVKFHSFLLVFLRKIFSLFFLPLFSPPPPSSVMLQRVVTDPLLITTCTLQSYQIPHWISLPALQRYPTHISATDRDQALTFSQNSFHCPYNAFLPFILSMCVSPTLCCMKHLWFSNVIHAFRA